jgi:hypothetical protein
LTGSASSTTSSRSAIGSAPSPWHTGVVRGRQSANHGLRPNIKAPTPTKEQPEELLQPPQDDVWRLWHHEVNATADSESSQTNSRLNLPMVEARRRSADPWNGRGPGHRDPLRDAALEHSLHSDPNRCGLANIAAPVASSRPRVDATMRPTGTSPAQHTNFHLRLPPLHLIERQVHPIEKVELAETEDRDDVNPSA